MLVISFTDLGRDARLERQIDFVSSRHEVVAAGLGPPGRDDVEFVDLRPPRRSGPRRQAARAALALRLLARRWPAAYWGVQLHRVALERLEAVRPDLVIANDVGPISNPDGLRNQLEGGALHGVSRTLNEEVTWDDKKVTSVDWRSYHSLTLGAEMPAIECVLINQTSGDAMGAGETAITLVAAAVGNAVFDATGARLRQVPFTPERVKAALDARGRA